MWLGVFCMDVLGNLGGERENGRKMLCEAQPVGEWCLKECHGLTSASN